MEHIREIVGILLVGLGEVVVEDSSSVVPDCVVLWIQGQEFGR